MILVWNMHLEQFVVLKKYMRYNYVIWTKHLNFSEEDWKNL